MIREVDEEEKGCVTFPEFLSLMVRRLSPSDNEEELLEAFKVFDRVSQNRFVKA